MMYRRYIKVINTLIVTISNQDVPSDAGLLYVTLIYVDT